MDMKRWLQTARLKKPLSPSMESPPRKRLLGSLLSGSEAMGAVVWVQGTVELTVGKDILILSDSSGRAKVTHYDQAVGSDKKCIAKGAYCCIIGTVLNTKGLPEIQASKFIDLTDHPAMKLSWDSEVKEAQLFLSDKLKPTV